MKKLKLWWRILTTPSCWERQKKTSKELSDYINRELDKKTPIQVIDEYEMRLGDVTLWIKNYPYSFGYFIRFSRFGMPDRATVFRLYDALQELKKESEQKSIEKEDIEYKRFLEILNSNKNH